MRERQNGFSLLELLVTIAVVALLTGIAIPVLSEIFNKRRDLGRINNIRSTSVDFLVYATDHDGAAPNVGVPGIENSSTWYAGMATPEDMMSMYLAIKGSWPLFLNAYFRESHACWHPPPGPRLPDSLISVGHTPDDYGEDRMLAMPSEYRYSLNFVTKPDLWEGSQANLNAGDILPFASTVRFDMSAFPSSKGVLFHQSIFLAGKKTSVAFVDGSAAAIPPDDFLAAVPYPLGDGSAPYDPVLGTRDGYLGRDVSR